MPVKPSYDELTQKTEDLGQQVAELEKFNAVFKHIFSSVSDGVYIIDQQYNLLHINHVLEEAFGPAGDNSKCYKYLNSRKKPCPWCRNDEVFAGNIVQWRWHVPDSDRVYEVYETPLGDTERGMVKTTFLRDVTRQLRVEKEVRENRQLLESIANNSTAVINVKDRNGKYLLVNRQYEKLFLSKGDDIIGKRASDIFPHEQAVQIQYNDRQVVERREGIQFEEVISLEDGLHTYLSNRFPISDDDGEVCAVGGISTDITELKKMENALQEKNEQLLSLINASPDIICFKDGEGRWLLANTADLKLFELEDVDYAGKKDSELALFSEFYRDAFLTSEETDEQAWNKGTISRSDELIPTPHDGTKVYDVIKVPLFHADGSRKGLVVLGRDFTSRVQAEEALRSEMTAHQDSLKKLEDKNIEIQNTNTALQVLLDQHKAAGKEVEEQVTINLKKLVFPYIDFLQQTVSGENEKEYLEIIKAHLSSLANSFTQKLSSSNFGLTPREILVADLIKQGKSTKDIAQLLGLAPRSIEAYRNSLRKKLNINQKKINLRQYLLSTFSPEE